MSDLPTRPGDRFMSNTGRIAYEVLEADNKKVRASRTTAESYSVVEMSLEVWRDLFDCWRKGA